MSSRLVPSEDAAHGVVDELMPESFEWERLVRTYPVPALLLAAAGGFILGRSRGRLVAGALASFAAARVADEVNRVLGEDVLEPE